MSQMAVAISDEELVAARRRGFGVAYRMLGSVSEAEDVAQEAVLRLARADAVAEPSAWVTTAATRLSIDVLRSARVRRETYVGPWLPEPLMGSVEASVEEEVEQADSLSQAFLVMLERLNPVERAALLLRDVFDYGYDEIAHVIDRSEVNSRQLVSRARSHLESGPPRYEYDDQRREELLERFMAAAADGDLAGLESLLAKDAAFWADGGGKVIAARKPQFGATRVARIMAGIVGKSGRRLALTMLPVRVNGGPGYVMETAAGEVFCVLSVDFAGDRIQTVRVMRNPDKLSNVQAGPTSRA